MTDSTEDGLLDDGRLWPTIPVSVAESFPEVGIQRAEVVRVEEVDQATTFKVVSVNEEWIAHWIGRLHASQVTPHVLDALIRARRH